MEKATSLPNLNINDSSPELKLENKLQPPVDKGNLLDDIGSVPSVDHPEKSTNVRYTRASEKENKQTNIDDNNGQKDIKMILSTIGG